VNGVTIDTQVNWSDVFNGDFFLPARIRAKVVIVQIVGGEVVVGNIQVTVASTEKKEKFKVCRNDNYCRNFVSYSENSRNTKFFS
jgi:hypothetical protein